MRLVLLVLTCQCFVTMLNAQPSSSHAPAVAATMQTYSIRLKPGQDLKKSLEMIVQQERISAGAVLTCAGSLTDLTLRLANQETASVWRGHFEIVSLVGTLSIYRPLIQLAEPLGDTYWMAVLFIPRPNWLLALCLSSSMLESRIQLLGIKS